MKIEYRDSMNDLVDEIIQRGGVFLGSFSILKRVEAKRIIEKANQLSDHNFYDLNEWSDESTIYALPKGIELIGCEGLHYTPMTIDEFIEFINENIH